MHDNIAKNVDIGTEEKGTGASFLSPLVLNIAQKENVSFDDYKK